MATAHGQSTHDLKTTLVSEGHRFAFFQALRLLNRLPDTKFRIRPQLSLGFPASDIARIEERPDGKGFIVDTTFLGLYGTSSPLPSFYTSDLFRDESPATRDFIDILHQRLYGLLFESWKKNRLFIQTTEARNTACLDMLLGLCGLSQAGMPEGDPAASLAWIRYAGLLGGHPRSALGLETILADVLGGVAVEVIPFVPRTVKIPQDQQLHLGSTNTVLGQDSFVGEECIDRQGKFRVRVGPLNRPRFRSLLQGGKDHQKMVELITHYVTDPLDYDFELILEGAEIQPTCLGTSEGSKLGLDTALFAGDFPGDLNVVFPPAVCEARAAA